MEPTPLGADPARYKRRRPPAATPVTNKRPPFSVTRDVDALPTRTVEDEGVVKGPSVPKGTAGVSKSLVALPHTTHATRPVE